MSGRGSPEPAFVSALAVFSKGPAFAFEARKWSRQGPSREALAWLLAPLASIWPAFGGQFGRKDGIENQRKFETKIRNENDRKILPRASKIRSSFDLEKQVPHGRFWAGRPRPPQGCPRLSQASLWAPLGLLLVLLGTLLGSFWDHFRLPWRPFAPPWPPQRHHL